MGEHSFVVWINDPFSVNQRASRVFVLPPNKHTEERLRQPAGNLALASGFDRPKRVSQFGKL